MKVKRGLYFASFNSDNRYGNYAFELKKRMTYEQFLEFVNKQVAASVGMQPFVVISINRLR